VVRKCASGIHQWFQVMSRHVMFGGERFQARLPVAGESRMLRCHSMLY
jgi:hypothetical protein